MNENKVMTIPQLAKATGVSAFAIRKLCHEGRLAYLQLENRWLIRLEDFNKLFKCEVQQKDD